MANREPDNEPVLQLIPRNNKIRALWIAIWKGLQQANNNYKSGADWNMFLYLNPIKRIMHAKLKMRVSIQSGDGVDVSKQWSSTLSMRNGDKIAQNTPLATTNANGGAIMRRQLQCGQQTPTYGFLGTQKIK